MSARPPLRLVDLTGSPGDIGRRHGVMFASSIRAYADERIAIVESGAWSGGVRIGRDDVLALADRCVAAHADYSPDLYAELEGIAEGAGLSVPEAIIVGGFTDFVDVVRAATDADDGPAPLGEDDCTAALVPGALTDGNALFGQTWDMHASATPHVVMLRIRPESGPTALVFTTNGCLGQIGMSSEGVCVGVNNLTGGDGRPGVTWPTVVREMLRQRTADDALDALLRAPLAGAHSYLVLDANGVGYCVEAMSTVTTTVPLRDRAVVHTNHTLDPASTAVQGARSPDLQAGSVKRLETARRRLDRGGLGVDDLMALTRDRDAICLSPEPPYHLESAGAVIARPADRSMWAVWGQPAANEYERIGLEPTRVHSGRSTTDEETP